MSERGSRRSRRPTAQILWPTPGPMRLGGRATLRYRSARSATDDDRRIQAWLRCTEMLPDGGVVVASDTPCPSRTLASSRWFEAEFDIEIPLGALPTMAFAGHRVAWTLLLHDTMADGEVQIGEWPVVVAPEISVAVLQGDRTP